jgi:hypothetical protein
MRRALGAVLTSLALVAIATASPASADSGRVLVDLHDGYGWVHDSTTPLLSFSRLAPGSVRSASFAVRNASADSAELSLASLAVSDDDNGCNHPESLVDSTCGSGEGDLGHELQLRVYVDRTHSSTFAATPTWTGSVYDLNAARTLDATMPSDGQVDIKVEAELPLSSGNETQTDQLGFDLKVMLASATGEDSTEVKGVKRVRGGGGLPFTGSSVLAALEVGVGLVLLGVLVLTSIRRRPLATS